MQELINYEFLSVLQFSIVVLVCSILFFIVSRFHLFSKQAKERSIGFRMFMYILAVVILVSFVLMKPFFNILLILVVFGMFYKNIVSYSRALFSLYFSRVKFGDKISIGNETGILNDMNFGGLHMITTENKVYLPFNMWKANKIILESESGTILFSFKCKDYLERNEYQSMNDLKKSIFSYPYLAMSNVLIEKEVDIYKVAVRIDDQKYKGGLESHIDKAGFSINRNKN